MAKYRITESQFKHVISHLNLNESELKEFDSVGYNPVPNDTPDYALTNLTMENQDGAELLAFYWEEEGTGRVFKATLDALTLHDSGIDPQAMIAEFQAQGQLTTPEFSQIENGPAWDNAEYLHDGQNDSDFHGN